MIIPTVGRVVWYRPHVIPGLTHFSPADADNDLPHIPGQPMAAIIAAVWNETSVALTVFDVGGLPHPRPIVFLWDGQGEKPKDRRYCEWMPYQKGQAAKTEELEKQVARGAGDLDYPEPSA